MTGHVNQLAAPNRRLSSLIIPREHGAWGLLLLPLATGGAVGALAGGNAVLLAPLTVAALVLFWLRTPLESWLGTGLIRVQTDQERKLVVITILLLAKAATVALVFLFWMRRTGLLYFGLGAALAFFVQPFLRKLGRRGRMPAQIVGMLGLTLGAPAAYYVVTGQMDRTAWILWTANFLFAGNQIHFVQLRIGTVRLGNWKEKVRRGSNFLVGQGLLTIALMFLWGAHLLPAPAGLAFAPILARGISWFVERQTPLVVRSLGWSEMGHAILFGFLFVAGFAASNPLCFTVG